MMESEDFATWAHRSWNTGDLAFQGWLLEQVLGWVAICRSLGEDRRADDKAEEGLEI
jgi:hypothetical protein